MDSQPGLEVSPHQSYRSHDHSDRAVFESGLEVVPEQPGLYPADPKPPPPPPPVEAEKIVASSPPVVVAAAQRKRRLWWIIGGVVLVVVVIAAVVGGVVGSRASRNSSDASEAPSSTTGTSTSSGTTTSPTPTNTLVRQNSRLAVTGYRIKDTSTFRFRLFFQDIDNHIRYSDYFSYNDSWIDTILLDNISAAPGTPLAASSYLEHDPPDAQLYFLNKTSILKCLVFRPDTGVKGKQRFGVANLELEVDPTTRLGAYHPFLVTQLANDSMLWIRDSDTTWPNRTLQITGSPGTSMAVLSAAVTYSKSAAILYRDEDGYLTSYVADRSRPSVLEEDWSWYYGQVHAEIPSSSIGAFAYARGEDNFINTYALYQGGSGELQYMWQNDSSAWQGPATDEVLGDADDGTDIVCLTEQAWDGVDVTLKSKTDMNRCFFQRGEVLWQVLYDGKQWQDLGPVPLK